MSHKATYWLATVDPKIITAGSFRVLFHLCDHHNDERDPEAACFPSQGLLREKTGLSNGGLNKCLDALERANLLRRKRTTIPGQPTQRTYYILGCDMPSNTKQTPQNGVCANSTQVETAREQTPPFDGANSTFLGGKLHPSGEEPVKEPVREPSIDHFAEFWAVVPKKVGKGAARAAFKAAVKKAKPSEIIEGMARYAQSVDGRDPQFTKHPATWLRSEGWDDELPESPTYGDPKDAAAIRRWKEIAGEPTKKAPSGGGHSICSNATAKSTTEEAGG